MNSHPFHHSFAKQFRQHNTVEFSTEGTSYHNLLFKTFGKNESEFTSLVELLTPQLHDENIIHCLLARITNNDMPNAERLHTFAKETSKKLLAHANAELYTSPYYSHIMKVLQSFLDLVDDFETNGIHMLSSKLTEYFTNEINQAADSDDVNDLYGIMEDYMYRIGEYFQHFHLLLQNESESHENKARILVMSQVAYYLDKIFILTEKLISNTESTLDLLTAWETAILNREEQELYN